MKVFSPGDHNETMVNFTASHLNNLDSCCMACCQQRMINILSRAASSMKAQNKMCSETNGLQNSVPDSWSYSTARLISCKKQQHATDATTAWHFLSFWGQVLSNWSGWCSSTRTAAKCRVPRNHNGPDLGLQIRSNKTTSLESLYLYILANYCWWFRNPK